MTIWTFHDSSNSAAYAAECAVKLGGRVITKSVTAYGYPAREVSGVEFAEGCVISKSSGEVRIMSDVYGTECTATYWSHAEGRPVTTTYALYADVSCTFGEAAVDATDEVKELEAAYYAGRSRGTAFANAEHAVVAAAAKAAAKVAAVAKAAAVAKVRATAESSDGTARVGDTVEATKGNKTTPKGTTGVVFWAGWSARHDASWRVGFNTSEGETHWLAGTGVKVVAKGSPADPGTKAPVPAASKSAPPPAKGTKVTVVSGSGSGSSGRIIWVGTDRLSGASRVGVKVSDGSVVWTAAANVASTKEAA